LQLFPATAVFVEFFNPHTQQWSDEVSQLVAARVGRQPDRAVTVKNTARGLVHRFDVTADATTVDDVAQLQFCATGDLPMFHLFAADNGRLLNPCEVVYPVRGSGASAALLPSPTVYVVHRPRPWLGEPLEVQPLVRHQTVRTAQPDSGEGTVEGGGGWRPRATERCIARWR
jgi:hypothetical protein